MILFDLIVPKYHFITHLFGGGPFSDHSLKGENGPYGTLQLQTFKGLIAETLHDHFGEWTPIVLTCPPISSDYIIIIGIYTLFCRGLVLSKQNVIIIFIISNIGKTSLQYLSIFLCLRGNNSQWFFIADIYTKEEVEYRLYLWSHLGKVGD